MARPLGFPGGAAAAALLGAVVVGAEPQVLGAIGLAAGAIGIPIVWARAPERAMGPAAREGTSRRPTTLSSPPVIALAVTHLVMLWRTERTAFHRGSLAALAGGAVAALSASNNEVTDEASREALTLAIGALHLSIATGGMAGPILSSERHLGWLLDTAAVGAPARALSASAATVLPGLTFGILYGVSARALMNWTVGANPLLGMVERAADPTTSISQCDIRMG